MRRRAFIAGLGSAATWPRVVRAQQAMPVIGYLNAAAPDGYSDSLSAFRRGFKESGYIEGENITIEYCWAENNVDRLSVLAAHLLHEKSQ